MAESLRDPILGTLVRDDGLQCWIGKMEWVQRQSIEVFISAEENLPEPLLGRIRVNLGRIRSRDPEYRLWTAERVQDDRWNSDEDMSVEEIAELLKLASIDFRASGEASLYWNDDDRLYGGHTIITEIDADGTSTEVRMEG